MGFWLIFRVSILVVVGLSDCEDSSVCKMGCEKVTVMGCEGKNATSTISSTCCYPLSDRSVWRIGDGFSVFSNFGCRGFSSWVQGKRGVKLEWAVPKIFSKDVCAINGFIVNATTIKAGVRCKCQNGFIGDGFVGGVGCLKSCIKDGHEAYGRDCYIQRHKKKKTLLLAVGFFASAFLFGSIAALYGLSRRPIKSGTWDPDPGNDQSDLSFRKASRTRLFTYEELDLATKGFDDEQKLVDGINGTVHAGVLSDGSHVAVHKVQCKNEQDLVHVLSRVEILSMVSHKHVSCILGCCIDLDRTPLVIYQFSANGTLEENLNHGGNRKSGLDWYQRLNIAAEIASTLAYLQHQISPPIYHHDLKSGNIYLDQEYSIKIAGFGLLNFKEASPLGHNAEEAQFYRSDVYNLGVILLEIIAGSKHVDLPNVALAKIRSRKVEEIVDPLLYYHEQPQFRREQIEVVADIAARCLLFGGDGRLSMMDVARELIQITKDSLDGSVRRGPAIEETFSNSSLLQMISMSPDSSFVH
ncbi:Protein kinase domain [Macleaya cordata]|uniref:Protein kinase domain n=1 Tax=Macleaya cordata TaxID=56857 RepID=A0A200RB21_MACCD|nr:Protein kinase domain [Macleaya cordata]